MTPTQRSLERLRRQGFDVDVVERKIPKANITHDFLGFVDIIGLRGQSTIAVQTTSASNVNARWNKILLSPHLDAVREAGWRLVVWGWRADGRLREVVVLPGRLPGWTEQLELPFEEVPA